MPTMPADMDKITVDSVGHNLSPLRATNSKEAILKWFPIMMRSDNVYEDCQKLRDKAQKLQNHIIL